MKAKRKLMPGEPGTKKLVQEYGDKLVCIRYRYDSEGKRRVKTVELIVEEAPVNTNARKIPKNKIMHIRIDYGENYLQRVVKAAGGKWNREKKVWELPYKDVAALGLTDRMVEEWKIKSQLCKQET